MLLFIRFEQYCALHRNGVKPVFLAEQLLGSYSYRWTCLRCVCNKEDSSLMPGTLLQWPTPWEMPRPISPNTTITKQSIISDFWNRDGVPGRATKGGSGPEQIWHKSLSLSLQGYPEMWYTLGGVPQWPLPPSGRPKRLREPTHRSSLNPRSL